MVFGLFGRRAKPAMGIPQPPPGLDKIFPDELWQGEMGKVLRDAGFSPDDASNLVPTPERVAERIARDQAAFQAKLMTMNDEISARTNGGFVQPFFLFPEPCWNGDTGHFLTVRLRMSPYEDWNVVCLPTEERWCAVLGLPRHPNQDALLFQDQVNGFLSGAIAHLDEIRRECDRTGDFGLFGQRLEKVKALIRDYGGTLREQYTEVWNSHVAGRPA
jgi:hypothetical protein